MFAGVAQFKVTAWFLEVDFCDDVALFELCKQAEDGGVVGFADRKCAGSLADFLDGQRAAGREEDSHNCTPAPGKPQPLAGKMG